MTPKQIKFGTDARDKMLEGVKILSAAVGSTLGPGGRLVALTRDFGPVMMTKDGVTVAEEIHFKDSNLETGARLCKQVARQCDELAGDGTTTATVLAHTLIVEGNRAVDSGSNPVLLKKGIDKCVEEVVEYLKKESEPITLDNVDQVKYVASISGNDETVGQTVSEAFVKAGPYGVVVMEENRGRTETIVEKSEGLEFDRGWSSNPAGPYFINNPAAMTTEFNDPLILLWEKAILDINELKNFLEGYLKAGLANRPLVIIADDVKDEALGLMISNLPGAGERSPNLPMVAVRAPRFGEQRKAMMEDLALLTGGKFFSEAMAPTLSMVKHTDLGTARKLKVTRDSTIIYDGGGDPAKLSEHIEGLHNQLKELENKHDQDKIKERIAKLTSGVVVIKVGSHNPTDLKEKKFRYEDAISATRSALQEGILPGGGSALLRASMYLNKKFKPVSDVEAIAKSIVVNSLRVPVSLISENAGFSGREVVGNLLRRNERSSSAIGFNAATGQYGDMKKMGIVDPTKVERLAVENSANIAGMFLTTEAVITDEPKSDDGPQPGQMM